MDHQKNNDSHGSSEQRRFFLKKSVMALAGVGLSNTVLAGYGRTSPSAESDFSNSVTGAITMQEAKIPIPVSEDEVLNALRSGVLWLLKQVPKAGTAVSWILEHFWQPYGVDPMWKGTVEDINKIALNKIQEATFARLQTTLQGMRDALANYRNDCKVSSGPALQSTWQSCRSLMDYSLAQFEPSSDRSLYPLYIQAALICATVRRDGLVGNDAMAWTQVQLDHYLAEASEHTAQYLAVADRYYSQIMAEAYATKEDPYRRNFVLREVNRVRNAYYRTVGDFRDIIEMMDPLTNPGQFDAKLPRILYLDPYGFNPRAQMMIDFDKRTSRMTPPVAITLYSGGAFLGNGYQGAVTAIDIDWGGFTGPNHNWSQWSGRHQSDDQSFRVSNLDEEAGPITSAWIHLPSDQRLYEVDDVPTLQFGFLSGVYGKVAGGRSGNYMPTNYSFEIDDHVLADIVSDRNAADGGPSALVFGFQLLNMGQNMKPEQYAQMAYRASMTELTAAELFQQVEEVTSAARAKGLLRGIRRPNALKEYIAANIDSWKIQRQASWAHHG